MRSGFDLDFILLLGPIEFVIGRPREVALVETTRVELGREEFHCNIARELGEQVQSHCGPPCSLVVGSLGAIKAD